MIRLLLEELRESAARDLLPGPWVPGARRFDEALIVYMWATDLVHEMIRQDLCERRTT